MRFLPFLFLGCAPRMADLETIRTMTSERVGQPIPTPPMREDAVATAHVAELLAQPMSMDQASELALLNNHRLRADLQALAIARGELIGAVLPPNPELHLETFSMDRPLEGSLELGVSENLSDLLRIPLEVAVATAELEATRQQAAGTVLDMLFDARSAWVRHTASLQILEMHETVLSAASASYNIAMRMNMAGNLSDLDTWQERLLFEDARLSRDRAELAAFATRQALGVVLGLSEADGAWAVEGSLPEPGPDDSELAEQLRQAVDNSLDLAVLDARYKAANRRAYLARTEGLLPEIHLGIAGERVAGEWEIGPSLGAELPVFYHAESEIIAAVAEARRLEHLAIDQAVRIQAGVRTASESVDTARARAIRIRDVLLPLHEDIVAETLKLYNGMLVGVFRLLDSRRMQIEAQRAYIEAVRDYWLARIELERILAGRMPEYGSSILPGPSNSSSTFRGGGH